MTFLHRLTLYIGWVAPTIPSPHPSLLHLKQFQEASLFYFICVYEAHQPYSLIFISFIYTLLPQVTPSPPMVPILQSYPSFLIPNSMFKGVAWCIRDVSILYFSQFNSLCLSPLTLPSCPPLFNSFQYILLCPMPVTLVLFFISGLVFLPRAGIGLWSFYLCFPHHWGYSQTSTILPV
jgi:hypothetical protein